MTLNDIGPSRTRSSDIEDGHPGGTETTAPSAWTGKYLQSHPDVHPGR